MLQADSPPACKGSSRGWATWFCWKPSAIGAWPTLPTPANGSDSVPELSSPRGRWVNSSRAGGPPAPDGQSDHRYLAKCSAGVTLHELQRHPTHARPTGVTPADPASVPCESRSLNPSPRTPHLVSELAAAGSDAAGRFPYGTQWIPPVHHPHHPQRCLHFRPGRCATPTAQSQLLTPYPQRPWMPCRSCAFLWICASRLSSSTCLYAENREAVLELAADGQVIWMTPVGGETSQKNAPLSFPIATVRSPGTRLDRGCQLCRLPLARWLCPEP